MSKKKVFLFLLFAIGLVLPFTSLAANVAKINKADLKIYKIGKRDTPCSVHDPSTIIKCDSEYWLFATGMGISSYYSTDLTHWNLGPLVFGNIPPDWTIKAVPGFVGVFWAPDIIYLNDKYFLYFSVSTFGLNISAIGLATNLTLDPNSPNYHWADEGIVIQSMSDDNFNAIDPCVFEDPTNGSLWLTFGSFWSGIKLVQLDPSIGKRIAPDSPVYSLAYHSTIEAPYLYYHDGYYYLFVNWGWCCRGINSTYNIRVGRSAKVTGPYLDKEGINMLDGGGSLFLGTYDSLIGPGHVGILHEGNKYWLSCHFYDGNNNGNPTLAIFPLRWDKNDWPEIEIKSDVEL